MDPSISKDGTGKVPTKIAASTTSEPKRFLKRSEAQVDSAQTLQEPEQETTSAQKKRVLEALRLSADECSRPLNKCNIDQLLQQIRAALNQHDGISIPDGIKLIKDLTSYELQMVLIHCLSDEDSMFESTRACHNSRVKSLEAELESKHAEIKALKKQATASEQKASRLKRRH
ncbi:hypothetical protein Pint_31056 [Pistacia integerrima]|uniref:Uncharacterized protein n=1 Tax=Pistacia integerrima TaxID=434235 RepID=A0ACC0XLK3_9ROSI|nr:hypothetical protein Pint_31056 [Pistacia integerrima]